MKSTMDSLREAIATWSPFELEKVALILEKQCATDLRVYEPSFLAKSLENRRVLSGSPDKAAYIDRLSVDDKEAWTLRSSLTIGFSEFFRGAQTFALLAETILPRLIDATKRSGRHSLRVWSAGCAAGQEAWSIAMLLDQLSEERNTQIPFQIIATDISSELLSAARHGVYDAETVLNTPLRFIRKYFTTCNDTFTIGPALRNRVDFSFYDLLDDSTPTPAAGIYGDFDLLLCSNVLFYYRQDVRKRVIKKLCSALQPDGYLVTGDAERDMLKEGANFALVTPTSTIFRKRPHDVQGCF